jgi:hypothetical protein
MEKNNNFIVPPGNFPLLIMRNFVRRKVGFEGEDCHQRKCGAGRF